MINLKQVKITRNTQEHTGMLTGGAVLHIRTQWGESDIRGWQSYLMWSLQQHALEVARQHKPSTVAIGRVSDFAPGSCRFVTKKLNWGKTK
jgi:hypothetical protein